ncbi:hypothetical protein [Serratia fonticola]|uniref:hypothetical protein n=1 Tax=Serratia fonticola TaxID=47917 RepID=UPI002DB73CC7|nr:hypothetical protein [Serratia fonticola]MEB7883905.1 hypothetical protein [Serratia fonticola]
MISRIVFIIVLTGTGVVASTQAAEVSSAHQAESPKSMLKIEDFFPAKKKWSISAGANILNSSDKGTSPAYYINQISPGNFTIDRTSLSYKKENNGVSGYTTVMYGLTNQLSLAATLNGQWMNTRYVTENGSSVTSNKYSFNGVGLGGSYQFYRLSDYTVFYGGLNIKNGDINSYVIGSSMNWIYDPLVLSFSLGYLDGISKERFSTGYRAYTTTGNIVFAVNPEVNVNWGVSKDYIYADEPYAKKKEITANTSLLLGTSINLMPNIIGNINVKGGVGGNNNSTLSFSATYKI